MFFANLEERRDVARYSPSEARRLMLETLHYGPWEKAAI